MTRKIPFPVSIDEDLAEKIKNAVEKKGFRNKSHLVETAIKQFLEEESK